MESERLASLMKYVRGEISFAEWIESGVGSGDAEQIEDDTEMQDGDGEADGEALSAENAGGEEQQTSEGEFDILQQLQSTWPLSLHGLENSQLPTSGD